MDATAATDAERGLDSLKPLAACVAWVAVSVASVSRTSSVEARLTPES